MVLIETESRIIFFKCTDSTARDLRHPYTPSTSDIYNVVYALYYRVTYFSEFLPRKARGICLVLLEVRSYAIVKCMYYVPCGSI